VQWCLFPPYLLEQMAALLAGTAERERRVAAEAYRAGMAAGYDRGYVQAETDMAAAQAQAVAMMRRRGRTPSWCELMRRRGQHPDTPCWNETCPLRTEEDRVRSADAYAGHTAERRFREATGPAQGEWT
jgi:hypothetical protein